MVNVSSLAHRGGKIDFDNLQAERKYNSWPAYQQSKLANLLFTFELQRRSDAYGWGLMSNAAHPGYARTDLIPNGPGTGGLKGIGMKVLGSFMSHSAAARSSAHTLRSDLSRSGAERLLRTERFYELKGAVAPAKVFPQAKNEAVARKLWEVSEQLTGVKWPAKDQTPETVPFPVKREA